MYQQNYKALSRCLACDSKDLEITLWMGTQPLANSFKKDRYEVQDEYPLGINRCTHCYHVQLTHAVNPDLLFKNYLYVSGTSKTMHDHMEEFAKNTDKFNFAKTKTVFDIGCNDGTQLDYYKKLGYKTFGMDPAENLAETSRAKGHTVICNYFTEEFAKASRSFDIVTAQNVFAHNSDPLDFLLGAKRVLNEEGTLYIQTSQSNMILNNEFDTIYHEHISFFNIQSMNELCKRAGLFLVGVQHAPIHGDSYIFVIRKKDDGRNVDLLIEEERQKGLYNENTYAHYTRNVHKIRNELIAKCSEYKRVVGYGAAAKGMTLLNFTGINLEFIVDDNPLKKGLYSPGMSIPIVGIEALDTLKEPVLFIPLAWNFFDEIHKKIKGRHDNPDDKFVTYFPKVEIKE